MFTLKNELTNAVKGLGFDRYTEIQERAIPVILKGDSMIGVSQTGSGKTHSFLLPLFERLQKLGEVQGLIISPTRDLAEQIYRMASELNTYLTEPIDIRLYIGGTDRDKELKGLQDKQPDLVIGTPGKLFDFVQKEKALFVHKTSLFVVDEADMAFEEGFLDEIDLVAGMMPEHLQMAVFSATIPVGLEPFLKKYMANPTIIRIQPKEQINQKITHMLVRTRYQDKFNLLRKVLKAQNPFFALIFTNTKETTKELADELRKAGYTVGELHGDLPVRVRKQMMRRIQNLEYQYVVASDIAARGIDLPNVSHVINYELPKRNEFYIHRTGRTARAYEEGIAISFYEVEDQAYFQALTQKGISFEYYDFKNDELVKRTKEQVKKDVSEEAEVPQPKPKKNIKVKPGYKKKFHRKLVEKKRKTKAKRR